MTTDPVPLILGEMSNPRSRQVVVKKMLELVLITDKAEVRRKRKEKGASTGARRSRKKKQADESSEDERPVRGESAPGSSHLLQHIRVLL